MRGSKDSTQANDMGGMGSENKEREGSQMITDTNGSLFSFAPHHHERAHGPAQCNTQACNADTKPLNPVFMLRHPRKW